MDAHQRLHASMRRETAPSCDTGTGEVRVPLTLFALDQPAGEADLVLSRSEATALFAHLRAAVMPVPQPVMRPEAVR